MLKTGLTKVWYKFRLPQKQIYNAKNKFLIRKKSQGLLIFTNQRLSLFLKHFPFYKTHKYAENMSSNKTVKKTFIIS